MFLLWLRQLPRCGDWPLLQFPHLPRAGPVLLTLLFFHLVLHSTKFCVVLYILFRWSGTPVHSQLVFCMHFCVWRCVPDVSVERDVLHVHLLLHHVVQSLHFLKYEIQNWIQSSNEGTYELSKNVKLFSSPTFFFLTIFTGNLPDHHCFPWLKSWLSFLFLEFRTCQWLLGGHTVTKVEQLWCFSV